MKITWATFGISALAIAGVPLLSGFFSKDEILWATYNAGVGPSWLPTVLWGAAFAAAGMTAFYIFRAVFLTFHGEDRVSEEAKHHLHESPPSMTMPLVVLATGAVVVGYLGVPEVLGGENLFHHWLAPVFGGGHAVDPDAGHALVTSAQTVVHATGEHSTTLEFLLMGLSVGIGLVGIGLAAFMYLRNPALPGKITKSLGGFYKLVFNKYYVDEFYERTIVRPGYAISEKVMYRIVDAGIIEGIVNGVGIAARLIGAALRLTQSGLVRSYAFFILLGFLYIMYKLIT